MSTVVPISAVVPTRDRAVALYRMLEGLAEQELLPAELIVVDGSSDATSRQVVTDWSKYVANKCLVKWQPAAELGAAVQRNQGVGFATQPFIWFLDDDILFEPGCAKRLWQAIEDDETLGGVNAMITNQRYTKPGLLTQSLYCVLGGNRRDKYAGKCIGPAFNILPEDDPALPEVVPVDWLNTTCTIYRRKALPTPPFHAHFTGYSLMEDLALSLTVGEKWKLANARTARIYHCSPPAPYKEDRSAIAKMELLNRHFIMTQILRRRSRLDYLKLWLLELFRIVSPLTSVRAWRGLLPVLMGKCRALRSIIGARHTNAGEAVACRQKKGHINSTHGFDRA